MRLPERLSDWGPIHKELLFPKDTPPNYTTTIQVYGLFTMGFFPGQTHNNVWAEWIKPNGDAYSLEKDHHWGIKFHPGEMRIVR